MYNRVYIRKESKVSKTITISDKAYNIIKQSAETNGRSLIKELDVLLGQFTVSSMDHNVVEHTPLKEDISNAKNDDEENKPWLIPKDERRVFTRDDSHTVVIPSVDTSQPRESVTMHKRWVPTTPEELEAELEKVRRGEREP